MMLREPVYVAALGASTSIGRDAWSSAAAVRGGISGFSELTDLTDTTGEPLRIAIAPWLDPALEGEDRFEELLVPAIEQALAPLVNSPHSDVHTALALALPVPRPGLPPELEAHLRSVVNGRFPGEFGSIGVFPAGHAGGLIAMYAACSRIDAGGFDACLVAGVDSYLTPTTLRWLEQNDQFHGAGPLNNAWGFIPGEAAGAALLVHGRLVERLRLDPMTQVLSVGRGVEPNRIKTETVCVGEGLTVAFREGLGGLPAAARVTDVYCDLNGEPYRADEFGFACLRTKDAFESASDFVAPADCWGDVSAASGPLHLALSAIASRKHYSNGPLAFVWASSESGERGAALVVSVVN